MTPAGIRLQAGKLGAVRALALGGLVIAAFLVAHYSWRLPLAIDAERAMFDTRAVLTAASADQDPRILLIAYNEETLRKTGKRFPLDRAILGRVLRRIDAMGARAIGIDILIDQPQPEDATLLAALRAMRTPTYIAFTTAAATPDVMLLWQEQFERRFLAATQPGMVRPASVRLEPDADGVPRNWPSRQPGLPPPIAQSVAGGAGGFADYDRSIVYRRPRSRERPIFAELPIDLFDGDAAAMLRDQVAGHYVLVGGDISDVDRFDTPLTRLAGHSMSGLEVQATMLAQRLDGARPAALSPLLLAALAVTVVLAGLAVGGSDVAGWRLALLLGAILGVIVLVPVALQAAGVDTQGLPAFGWLVGWTLAYSAAAAAARSLGSQERRFAQGALGRYLPPDVASAILRDPRQLSLHGERRTIFALFSDMEGFTKLTHAITPEMTATLLNRYLDSLSAVVLAHGGTLDKFVGDAVVAFWGAPIARADDGDRALAACMAMVRVGEEFRRSAPEGVPPIGRTRVGLHRGEAVVGNFGGEGRIQYTALGDAMNAAARLEGANKTLCTRALISAEAAAMMTEPPLRPMGRVVVRGRSRPLAVFEPVPGIGRGDIDDLAAILARFDAGDGAALADLADYAAERPGDAALGRLHDHLETSGPGGVLALD